MKTPDTPAAPEAPAQKPNRTRYTLHVDWPATGSVCREGTSDELQRYMTALCRRLDDNALYSAPLMVEIREVEAHAVRYL